MNNDYHFAFKRMIDDYLVRQKWFMENQRMIKNNLKQTECQKKKV